MIKYNRNMKNKNLNRFLIKLNILRKLEFFLPKIKNRITVILNCCSSIVFKKLSNIMVTAQTKGREPQQL